ncbi:MAG: hypothetical protein ACPG49_00330 [Chitinophagales bacterium]
MKKELIIPPGLQREMANTYRRTDLEEKMKPLVFKFLLQQEDLCLAEGIPVNVYAKIRYKSITKAHLVDLCCIPFLSKKLLRAFMASLPPNVRKILKGLIWNEELNENKIKSDYGITIVQIIAKTKNIYYKRFELKKEYIFFNSKKYYSQSNSDNRWEIYSLSIIPELRKVLIQYSPKPKNYYLNSASLPKTDFTYTGERDIFLELPRLIVYYEQGNIKLTAKDRLATGTQNKMQRILELAEFFENTEDKVLKNLRSNALASLLTFSESIEYRGNYVDLLKKLFLLYKKKGFFISLPRLLTKIKGLGHIQDWNLESVEPAFFELVKEMPIESWVTIENILDFIKYRNIDWTPIAKTLAHHQLYFEQNWKKGRGNKQYLKGDFFHLGIAKPLLKANFFLFAAFGLVEIAYNKPNTAKIAQTYYSPYDGLQAVRLTKLGAYIVGKKRKYIQAEDTKPIPLVLLPDSLMILSDENDTTSDILLQNYMQKVGTNRYQTDASIFLNGCSNKKQLVDKINLFTKTVSPKPPNNWIAFFNELRNKINPFEEVGNDYVLLKIPPNNRELIQLIAQDTVLKDLVLKGENFHIFVLKSKFSQLKSRLKRFGFLVD